MAASHEAGERVSSGDGRESVLGGGVWDSVRETVGNEAGEVEVCVGCGVRQVWVVRKRARRRSTSRSKQPENGGVLAAGAAPRWKTCPERAA